MNKVVRLRCRKCRRIVGKLERFPGTWMPDDHVVKNSDGTVVWPCRCGYRPPINAGRLVAAADQALEQKQDLVLGAPGFGIPQR